MNNLITILIAGVLFAPLITSTNFVDGVVGGPYTDKVSAELGSSDKSSGKGFNPEEIIVSVGTTVVWTNKDTVGHTVTSGSPSDADAGKLFDTGSRWNPGAKFEHTFDAVGEFSYFCRIHPWTVGNVVVAEVVIQQDEIEDVPADVPGDDITNGDIGNEGAGARNFLVEDIDGDRMSIRASKNNQDALDALTEMSKTGQTMWVGGEIQDFKNKFGFRFSPDTVAVAEITAEGLQAAKYKSIQEDIDYWRGLGTVYISGKVVSVIDKIPVNSQESSFNVTTTTSNGGVKNISVDPSSTSIIVALDTSATRAGNLTITLPRELIDSKNDDTDKKFIVKIGNDEADYKELKKTTDTERKLRISIPAGADQVEIIGTQVVPEFPIGLAVIFAGIFSLIVVMTRIRNMFTNPF